MQGHFPCGQALAAVAFAVRKSSSIVIGAPLSLYAEHSGFVVIRKSTLTMQQVLGYKRILSTPYLKVVQCHLVNPATFLAHEVQEREKTQDCTQHTKEGINWVEEDPILDIEALFIDSSSTIYQETGVRHTGEVVVKGWSHVPSEKLQDTHS
ncbi:hypothetical protein NDU88_003615 [Pleurodeles waltl]|uniref:Uncharacterized protein n=1 Tax=Pleurodeles waltl TaxID=8319 RepID=A0AAV7V0I4_PLEWA|nr:hypothetical protein NDU88_003615 [Pleurodeles waltl]